VSENSKKFRCVVKKIPTATGALILPTATPLDCSAAVLQQILQKTIETLLDLKAFNAHTQSQRADLAGSARQTKKAFSRSSTLSELV